jgi:uridine kinase
MPTFASLAAGIRAAEPRLGGTRLVCIDGPAGSGKTTLAARLALALGDGVAVVHMDDVYAGWTLSGGFERLRSGVLAPLAEGRAGAYRRYDWLAERFVEAPTSVPVPDVLIVEGCGSCPRAVDAWASLRIWVEAPPTLRLARGLARDGAELAEQWRQWQREENALFEAEDTRARADLRVDGAPTSSPTGSVALLDASPSGPVEPGCSILP